MKALWQDSRVKFITRVVRAHDRDLFAERSHLGMIKIMRRHKKMVQILNNDNASLYLAKESPQLVFALTDNWTMNGRPIDWGGEVVLQRLKDHDIQANEALFKQLEEQDERLAESKERDLKNKNEAWLSDNHYHFKKTFSDTRTCNFDKSERRRRRFEKNLDIKRR